MRRSSWKWSNRFFCSIKKNAGRWRFGFFSKTLWQTTQGCRQTYSILWGIKPVISLLQDYLFLLSGFTADLLKTLRGCTGLKDTLSSINFVIWQPPQDHRIFLSVHTKKKQSQSKKEKGLLHRTVPSGERERTLHSSCVYLNLTSDQITGG